MNIVQSRSNDNSRGLLEPHFYFNTPVGALNGFDIFGQHMNALHMNGIHPSIMMMADMLMITYSNAAKFSIMITEVGWSIALPGKHSARML